MNKQVSKEHYEFDRYCYPERWSSYYHQIREILRTEPKTVLEVGAGDETVKRFVVRATNASYTTLDVADDLRPDIVGSLLAIPTPSKHFDTVCAFEVLEHIPWDDVPRALAELARVSKRQVLISVPHFGPTVDLSIKIPFLPRLRIFLKIPFPKRHVFNGQHYWELGKKGYSVASFRERLSANFTVERDYISPESPYHHFFILSV